MASVHYQVNGVSAASATLNPSSRVVAKGFSGTLTASLSVKLGSDEVAYNSSSYPKYSYRTYSLSNADELGAPAYVNGQFSFPISNASQGGECVITIWLYRSESSYEVVTATFSVSVNGANGEDGVSALSLKASPQAVSLNATSAAQDFKVYVWFEEGGADGEQAPDYLSPCFRDFSDADGYDYNEGASAYDSNAYIFKEGDIIISGPYVDQSTGKHYYAASVAKGAELDNVPCYIKAWIGGVSRLQAFYVTSVTDGSKGANGNWPSHAFKQVDKAVASLPRPDDTVNYIPKSTNANSANYGWVDAPDNNNDAKRWWMTKATISGDTGKPIEDSDGECWSVPVPVSGEDGAEGPHWDFKYMVAPAGSTPTIPQDLDISEPDDWIDEAPASDIANNNAADVPWYVYSTADNVCAGKCTDEVPSYNSYAECLWMTMAQRDADNNVVGIWQKPIKVSGEDAMDGNDSVSVVANPSTLTINPSDTGIATIGVTCFIGATQISVYESASSVIPYFRIIGTRFSASSGMDFEVSGNTVTCTSDGKTAGTIYIGVRVTRKVNNATTRQVETVNETHTIQIPLHIALQGEQGYRGAQHRHFVWDDCEPGFQFYCGGVDEDGNPEEYYDTVQYAADGKSDTDAARYFLCKVSHQKDATVPPPNSVYSDTNKDGVWNEGVTKQALIASYVILADNADIKLLQGQGVLMMRDGEVTCGMTNGTGDFASFFANPRLAPIRVDSFQYATKATGSPLVNYTWEDAPPSVKNGYDLIWRAIVLMSDGSTTTTSVKVGYSNSSGISRIPTVAITYALVPTGDSVTSEDNDYSWGKNAVAPCDGYSLWARMDCSGTISFLKLGDCVASDNFDNARMVLSHNGRAYWGERYGSRFGIVPQEGLNPPMGYITDSNGEIVVQMDGSYIYSINDIFGTGADPTISDMSLTASDMAEEVSQTFSVASPCSAVVTGTATAAATTEPASSDSTTTTTTYTGDGTTLTKTTTTTTQKAKNVITAKAYLDGTLIGAISACSTHDTTTYPVTETSSFTKKMILAAGVHTIKLVRATNSNGNGTASLTGVGISLTFSRNVNRHFANGDILGIDTDNYYIKYIDEDGKLQVKLRSNGGSVIDVIEKLNSIT